jgi:hypothetical protein
MDDQNKTYTIGDYDVQSNGIVRDNRNGGCLSED